MGMPRVKPVDQSHDSKGFYRLVPKNGKVYNELDEELDRAIWEDWVPPFVHVERAVSAYRAGQITEDEANGLIDRAETFL